jgi:hypothetical protein
VYNAAPLLAGNWVLTPRKHGGVNGGISALDGAHVLQHVAGLRFFSLFQQRACDVTGDGTCSALDGTRILQYVADLLQHFAAANACQSDWVFVPIASPVLNQIATGPQLDGGGCVMGNLAYQPLTDSAGGQGYLAIPLGDVTGNWAP